MRYNAMDLSLFTDYMATVNVLPVCTWIYTSTIVLHKTENQEKAFKTTTTGEREG